MKSWMLKCCGFDFRFDLDGMDGFAMILLFFDDGLLSFSFKGCLRMFDERDLRL